jgi:hypothetical protein
VVVEAGVESNPNVRLCRNEQISTFGPPNIGAREVMPPNRTSAHCAGAALLPRAEKQGDENMLGIIAAVFIVLWLLAFFAFHVTSGLIHIVLAGGLILLLLHFVRGSSSSA